MVFPSLWGRFFLKKHLNISQPNFFQRRPKLTKRKGFVFALFHSPDFLHPPPLGLTVPRCSKSSRIFPASYPSQKCHLIWPKALERKKFRAANFGRTNLWKPDCPALTHLSHLTFFALSSWKEFSFPRNSETETKGLFTKCFHIEQRLDEIMNFKIQLLQISCFQIFFLIDLFKLVSTVFVWTLRIIPSCWIPP